MEESKTVNKDFPARNTRNKSQKLDEVSEFSSGLELDNNLDSTSTPKKQRKSKSGNKTKSLKAPKTPKTPKTLQKQKPAGSAQSSVTGGIRPFLIPNQRSVTDYTGNDDHANSAKHGENSEHVAINPGLQCGTSGLGIETILFPQQASPVNSLSFHSVCSSVGALQQQEARVLNSPNTIFEFESTLNWEVHNPRPQTKRIGPTDVCGNQLASRKEVHTAKANYSTSKAKMETGNPGSALTVTCDNGPQSSNTSKENSLHKRAPDDPKGPVLQTNPQQPHTLREIVMDDSKPISNTEIRDMFAKSLLKYKVSNVIFLTG